jgi:cellulose synthase/poly-beta-1,6-N-acetylglucosamine synthase-like glycosyltransferase
MSAIPLYILGGVNLGIGVYSLFSTLGYYRYAKRSRQQYSEGTYCPSVALLVPCCGDEEGLEENLRALVSQDYEALKVIFIVEDGSDPAVPIIKRVLGSENRSGELVVAGPAERRGQKIHNLIAGLGRAGDAEVFAFADSDGRPDGGWLAHLVSPLRESKVGVASSYRFYLPEPGCLASVLRSAWNAGVLTLLGEHDRNFAWGGSMAIRRKIFEEAKVEDAWRGALSDDYALTHAVRRAGYHVKFVPRSIVASRGRVKIKELLRWCARQMAITRVYWPNLWRIGGGSQVAFVVFLVGGSMAAASGNVGVTVLLSVVLLLSWLSGGIRARAVRFLLPRWSPQLRRYEWAYVLLAPVASFITVYAFLRSALSRRIEWRGKVYEMLSPSDTLLLGSATPSVEAKARKIR